LSKARSVESWGVDGFVFTEAARGGALAWRLGDDQLTGDALGPVRHAHDDAGEYYYMFSGSAHVETGEERFVLNEGQLGYIPPNAPHNFLGPASDADACLFCVVAPNLAENKWRLEDFLPGSESLRMAVATPFEDRKLPGDGRLAARAVALEPDVKPLELVPESRELFHLVLAGELEVEIENGLAGSIETGRILHVRAGVRHALSAHASCRVLSIECSYQPWKGVALGD
jgi:mannose-6-phosphate isomerase-like protein (cupin superfamily)